MEPEDREFMRQLTHRHERSTAAAIRTLDRINEEMRRMSEEMRELREECRRGFEDLHAKSQAQTQAIFTMIDRLA